VQDRDIVKHIHTQPFYYRNYPGEPVPEKNLLNFMAQREISEAGTHTIRLGATPSRLIRDPPPSSPIFTPDAFPAATIPIYTGLGKAPNMLACIPSGLVRDIVKMEG